MVLEMLSEKPMSGSEIMDRIEEKTHESWRPSPGSIYPLLTWLQEKGFIKALPRDESGIKRYELTEKGKKLLEDKNKIKERLVERMVSFPLLIPPLFSGRFPEDRLGELHTPIKRLFIAFRDFMILSRDKATKEDLAEVGRVFEEAAEKIEELNRKFGR
ncbi:MAG: PadR family transcriptional regulator [Candidatus Jordarchaeales archaeon]